MRGSRWSAKQGAARRSAPYGFAAGLLCLTIYRKTIYGALRRPWTVAVHEPASCPCAEVVLVAPQQQGQVRPRMPR
jgi:hypothetical protein